MTINSSLNIDYIKKACSLAGCSGNTNHKPQACYFKQNLKQYQLD